eukprot:CAMPEP_0198662442 /NCGR_PEP_ID=MMETSP1467-20131203/47436_1 /TAXON_ID=1462469 /ORGANISM="unid. sp., Strain CCMP2135" /LENGTH=262 /DNA_ID=CAMNT_0044398929 /DNA_START=69 /DNA_END=857 /DNA_ORIENTATION=+
MTLEGKRALVTGAASGIGAEVARRLQEAGARVHVCDIDGAAAARFAAAHPGIGTSVCDVADENAVDLLFDALTEDWGGGLDILVNNAGVAGPTGRLEDCESAAWRRTLDVNLDAAFLCTRRAVPLLRAAKGGVIINVSSTAGLQGYPLRAPYAAAKWALIGLTKSLAMELGEDRIRVNAICPGAVAGDRMDRVIGALAEKHNRDPADVRSGYEKAVSLRRFVTAADVADMLLFACSDAARNVTGQALAVDGHTENMQQPCYF